MVHSGGYQAAKAIMSGSISTPVDGDDIRDDDDCGPQSRNFRAHIGSLGSADSSTKNILLVDAKPGTA